MANKHTSRFQQMKIYFRRNLRGFFNDKGWKLLISVVLITLLICSVTGEEMFRDYDQTRSGALQRTRDPETRTSDRTAHVLLCCGEMALRSLPLRSRGASRHCPCMDREQGTFYRAGHPSSSDTRAFHFFLPDHIQRGCACACHLSCREG